MDQSATIILFLDFDGVLHPLFNFGQDGRTATIYEGPFFVQAPRLAELLEPYLHQIEIVISSSWGRTRSLDQLKALLPPVIATRVTDTIWIEGREADYRSALATRYRCIDQWLRFKRPGYEGQWLALDDDYRDWPSDELHRLVVVRGTLASPAVQIELADRLRLLMGPASR